MSNMDVSYYCFANLTENLSLFCVTVGNPTGSSWPSSHKHSMHDVNILSWSIIKEEIHVSIGEKLATNNRPNKAILYSCIYFVLQSLPVVGLFTLKLDETRKK